MLTDKLKKKEKLPILGSHQEFQIKAIKMRESLVEIFFYGILVVCQQFQVILSTMNQWRIIFQDRAISLKEFGLKSIKQNANQKEKQTKQTQPVKLQQTKIRQAKTLTNYLPAAFQTKALEVLKFCLPFFGANDNTLNSKLKSLRQKLNSGEENVGEMMKTCRKKQAFCFSSKWRQPQKILYLLVHQFILTQRQSARVRIHILNHRGLILQTVTNVESDQHFSEMKRIIQRHYSRFDSIVVFLPQYQVLNLDKINQFYQDLPVYQILILFAQKRQSFQPSIMKEICNYKHFYTVKGMFFGISTNQEIFLSHNQKFDLSKIGSILNNLSTITKREIQVGQLLEYLDYFSGYFSQKQLYLRFYAYLFNFITLEGMQPQKKQPIIVKLVDHQVKSFEKKAQETQKKGQSPILHTSIRHQRQLNCVVCKNRTKIGCEKCRLNFNKLFGVCQKGCFSLFHKDMASYIDSVQSVKKLYKIVPEDHQSPQNEQEQEESLTGRKILKKEASDDKISCLEKRESFESVEEITSYWKHFTSQNQREYEKLEQYGAVRLVSMNFLKKIQYMRNKIAETKAITTMLQKTQQIKLEPSLED